MNFLIVWVSFWFTIKWPLSHIYYINFPLIFLYSLYVYHHFASSPHWKTAARIYLTAAFVFQIAFAWYTYPLFSMYRPSPGRGLVVQAIDQKNYHLLGERRDNSYY